MAFPLDIFAGNNIVDYTGGASDLEFYDAAKGALWDSNIIAIQNFLQASGSGRIFSNKTGSTLDAGDLVYISGYDSVTNNLAEVTLADADAFASIAQYVVVVAAAANAKGIMAKAHKIATLNTSAMAEGDNVYLSETAGEFTDTAPSAPDVVQFVGRVGRVHASLGEVDFAIDRPLTPDDVGLEFATLEKLQIKALGVTAANIANNSLDGTKAANIADLGVGQSLIIPVTAAVGTTAVFAAAAPYKFQVTDAYAIATNAAGGTWKVTDGTNDIIPAVTTGGADTDVSRALKIDHAEDEILSSGTLEVVAVTGTFLVYITIMRIG